VAVLAILNLYGDVIYNKALILVLCVVYWLLFVCFYGKWSKDILLVGMVD